MEKKLLYAVIFLCIPLGILITAIVRRESTYQENPAPLWFKHMKILQQSTNLDALNEMRESAVPTLQMELKSQRIGYRLKAAWALGQLGTSARAAISDLIQSIDDKDMVVRANAIRSLALIDPTNEDLIPKLIQRLSDDNVGVNDSAAGLLTKIEQERSVKSLPMVNNEFEYTKAFLRSPGLRVKLMGLDRLMKLPQNDERVMAEFKFLLNDTNRLVREKTVTLLRNRDFMETNQVPLTKAAYPVGDSKVETNIFSTGLETQLN